MSTLNTYEPNIPVHVTSLFDPRIGYVYGFDLFERDLYRAKVQGLQNQKETVSDKSMSGASSRPPTF